MYLDVSEIPRKEWEAIYRQAKKFVAATLRASSLTASTFNFVQKVCSVSQPAPRGSVRKI